MRNALWTALSGLLLFSSLAAQESSGFREQQRLLELRRRHLAVRQAKAQFEGRRQLFETGLASRSELEAAETAYLQTQIEYQETFLSLFSEVPRITVLGAVKRVSAAGRRSVVLTLRNDSVGSLDYRQLGIVEGEVPLPDQLRLREINNVYVSLKDERGFIVSRPYEHFVERLPVGVETTLEFDLLRDVETVSVGLDYSGRKDLREVYLEKDASANVVTVQSSRFSQEGDLGGSVTYDLKLERFTSGADVFQLSTVDLPESVERSFTTLKDPDTRLSQIRFVEGETTKELAVRLNLPGQSEGSGLQLDRALHFEVLVLPVDGSNGAPGEVAVDSLKKRAAGVAELELIPRGVAKLEVRIPNLYQAVLIGEPVSFAAAVRNIGSRQIRSIRVAADAPFGWSQSVEPPVIDGLEPNQELPIEIVVKPPKDVDSGDYTVKLLTEAYAGNSPVGSEDKIARIKLSAPLSVLQSGVTVGILGLILLGIIGVGFKMMQR